VRDAGDLADVLQRDRIGLAVPTERHLHWSGSWLAVNALDERGGSVPAVVGVRIMIGMPILGDSGLPVVLASVGLRDVSESVRRGRPTGEPGCRKIGVPF
ncbi:hypothetical protein M3640_22210, partial [Bacillus velezensis]|nr:hypothetical protein [Bacillus velezensis]